MAEISQATTYPTKAGGDVAVTSWTDLASGDTGQPVVLAQFADRTVQVGGTFDGASLIFEGSNDGATYHTLMDPQGNALSFTAAGLEAVLELPLWVRPRVSGGGAGVAINVTLVGRRSF